MVSAYFFLSRRVDLQRFILCRMADCVNIYACEAMAMWLMNKRRDLYAILFVQCSPIPVGFLILY